MDPFASSVRFACLIWLGVVFTGCGADSAPVERAEPAIIDTVVGDHTVQFALPDGWQHLAQGDVQQIRGAGALLELADLGTYSWAGIKTHIQQARRLSEQGQLLAAQESLKKLPDLKALFLDTEDWHEIEHLWRLLIHRQLPEGKQAALVSYDALLRVLAYQPEIDFAAVTTRMLAIEDRNGQREVAERKNMTISGHSAIRITTWDRLTHTMEKSYLYVLNGDNILLLSVALGSKASYAAAFDLVVSSLEIM